MISYHIDIRLEKPNVDLITQVKSLKVKLFNFP